MNEEIEDAVQTLGSEIEAMNDEEDASHMAHVLRRLASFAAHKQAAIAYRKRGDIEDALDEEKYMQDEYEYLPDKMRW